MTRPPVIAATLCLLAVTACSGAPQADDTTPGVAPSSAGSSSRTGAPLVQKGWFWTEEVAAFDEPWAMTFLPDGRALVTERGGLLKVLQPADGQTVSVPGTPEVAAKGQGGLGDVVLSPSFAENRQVYLSWAESTDGGTRAVVGRGTLTEGESPRLDGLTPIWRQSPAVAGSAHYSHRMAFSPDGQYLFVTSGERQEQAPAQDLGVTLGKIVRLTPDGQPAPSNPFEDIDGTSAEIWSFGHRNPLGLAFAPDGRLWSTEMGPRGGDELNLIDAADNYGWPKASNGSQYSGADIPDHAPRQDGFTAPSMSWNPSVSPSSLMIYTGDRFSAWRGDAFVGTLSGQALIRIDLEDDQAISQTKLDMGYRIREVEQGPDGVIWLLTDGSSGQAIRLTV